MLSRYFLTGKGDRQVLRFRSVRRRFWTRSVCLLLGMVLSFTLCVQVGAKEEPKPIAQEWQIRGIEAALEDERSGVWGGALITLSRYDPQSIRSLAKQDTVQRIGNILKDKQQDSAVRSSAAGALGSFGEAAKSYIPDIAAILEDKQQDSIVRRYAAGALCSFGEAAKSYIPDILAFIRDKQQDSDVRSSAAWALGKITQLDFNQIFPILSPIYEEEIRADAWRFYAYFLSGGDEDVKRLLKWIGKPRQLPVQINHDEGVKTLEVFKQAWNASKDLPAIRDDLADKTAIVSKKVTWQTQDLPLLKESD